MGTYRVSLAAMANTWPLYLGVPWGLGGCDEQKGFISTTCFGYLCLASGKMKLFFFLVLEEIFSHLDGPFCLSCPLFWHLLDWSVWCVKELS